jgi:hypothetical protein
MAVLKLLAAAIVMLAHPAWDELARVRTEEAHLAQERTQLAAQVDAQAREIDALKAKVDSTSPKLQASLAQAQDLARRLQALDAQLQAKRRQIVSTADRVVAEERDAQLRTQAIQARADAASALAAPKPAAVANALGVRESATDSPEDLREKANLLKDTQDKVLRELAVLDKRFQGAQRRADLQRASRSLDNNLFVEDTRRQVAQVQPHTLSGAGGADRNTPTSGSPNPNPPPGTGTGPGQTGGTSGDSGFSSPGPTSTAGAPPAVDVIVLKDVLDPTTLADLSQPHDSARYLRALDRARQRLREIASDLDQRSRNLRKRADDMRKK